MRRWSPVVLLVVIAIAVPTAHSFDTDDSQGSASSPAAQGGGRGRGGAPQGWLGTPPSPEPPLEPTAPANVKEREVWIPPLLAAR